MAKPTRNLSPEYVKRTKQLRAKWQAIRCIMFAGILVIFMVIGLCMFARPKISETEKRKLAEFPAPTAQTIWDGGFFTALQTWYTDTYPLREAMISGGASLETLYGLKGDEIYGNVAKQVDEIPDVASPTVAKVIEKPATTEATNLPGMPKKKSTDSDAENATTTFALEEPEAGEDGTIREEPETAGTVYISDHKGFNVFGFNQSTADYYASMVNTLRARMPKKVNFYEMLVPTAYGVCLSDDIQESLGGSNESEAFDYIYNQLSPDVHAVSCINMLKKHNAEYIYFRTDHHWTALGAYYAYFELCRAMKVEPHTLDQFEKMEFDNFLGSFYSASNQSHELAEAPDTVEAYVPMGTNILTCTDKDGSVYDWPVINDVSEYPSGMKYSCFIAADNQISVVENPQITDGSACVLLKESYGNAFAPFLVDHYQTLYIIDYRYYRGDVGQLIRDNKVKDVILLNNAEALSTTHIEELLSIFP